jgi:outer membrane protein, multidrug efflux system
MIRNTLVIILAITCLAGCATMAPSYKRPASPVPAAWPTGPAYKEAADTKTAPAAADIGWRNFYADERLQKVIGLALSNNRDLRIAVLNIEKARALYGIQRAQLFPSINASGIWIEQRVPADISKESGEATNFTQYSVNAGVTSWELDFFGRLRSLKDRALEQYLATEQAGRSVQISLVAEVANAYLTFAADGESLKLAQSTLDAQEATYTLIRRRSEVGVSNELDLRQAQTRVEAARVDIARYTRQVALDVNALNLLVGSTVPPELLPGELNLGAVPKDVSSGLSSEVLLRRPDILQAEHQLKAANANIGAARAAFFPQISLTSTIGTTSDALSALFKAGSSTWTFAPLITMPIFDARLWSALDAINVEREIFLVQYEKAIQVAFREVADALAQRGTVGEQIAAQEALVHAWSEAYRLSDARYIKGIDGYLGVLEAQRSLYAAQQILIATHLSRLTNLVTLYKVLGGGGAASLPFPAKGQNNEGIRED